MSTEEDFDDIFDEASVPANAAGSEGELFGDIDETGVAAPRSKTNARGTVKISKKDYAVGLIWQTASNGDEAEAEAKLAAKDDLYRANTYCLREAAIIQYGLGQKSMGHRPGMRALAAVLADKLSGSWLAAFEVGNDIYLAAVRDGQILSDYDRLFSQVREARELFSELLYSAEWDLVLAPSKWAIEEADASDIEDHLDDGKEFRLKAAGSPLRLILLGAVGLAAIAAGGFVFMQPSNDSSDWGPPPDFGTMSDPMGPGGPGGPGSLGGLGGPGGPDGPGTEGQAVAPVEQPPIPPWVDRPNGIGMLIACTADIKAIPLDVPGWDTESATCSDSGISLSLSKTRGTVLWAQDYFRSLGHQADFGSQAGSESIRHRYEASFVSPYTSNVATQPIGEVERYLGFHFEELGQEITLDPPPNYTDNIIDRYYQWGGFSFDTDLEPTEFVDILSPIPAILIESVDYDIETGVWSVDARFYHKRANPIPPPAPEGAAGQPY